MVVELITRKSSWGRFFLFFPNLEMDFEKGGYNLLEGSLDSFCSSLQGLQFGILIINFGSVLCKGSGFYRDLEDLEE